jgi:hypothetical protein
MRLICDVRLFIMVVRCVAQLFLCMVSFECVELYHCHVEEVHTCTLVLKLLTVYYLEDLQYISLFIFSVILMHSAPSHC